MLILCDPMDCSPPGPSVRGIVQTKYWNGLPFPPPENLPNPGIELTSFVSPALPADSLPLSHRSTTGYKVEREDLKGVVGRGKAVGSESGWGVVGLEPRWSRGAAVWSGKRMTPLLGEGQGLAAVF